MGTSPAELEFPERYGKRKKRGYVCIQMFANETNLKRLELLCSGVVGDCSLHEKI